MPNPDVQRKQGFVAFIDILGFSELVARADFSQAFARYCDIIADALESRDDSLQYLTVLRIACQRIPTDRTPVVADVVQRDAVTARGNRQLVRLVVLPRVDVVLAVAVGQVDRLWHGVGTSR
jgi:hypothetical protein